MSDPGGASRHWGLYIQDMIAFSERVLAYTEGMDQEHFVADVRSYDATLRNLELIGEAAAHFRQHVRNAHREIEWRRIVATRHRVAHGYLGIDDAVWDIIQTEIPDLLPKLRQLLASEQGQDRRRRPGDSPV